MDSLPSVRRRKSPVLCTTLHCTPWMSSMLPNRLALLPRSVKRICSMSSTGISNRRNSAWPERFVQLGASVIGIDISSDSESTFSGPAWYGVRADVTDSTAVTAALTAGVERFGGIDIVVVAAGVFAASTLLTHTDRAVWDRTMN